MLIQIPKVYTKDTEEKTVDIWINTELIIKIEPCLNKKQPSIAKSIIAMRDVEPWNWFKSTMTPEEIVDIIRHKPYFDVIDAFKKYNAQQILNSNKFYNCQVCGNNDWSLWTPGEPYSGCYYQCNVCGTICQDEHIKIKENQ